MDISEEKKVLIAKKRYKIGDILCRQGEPCENIFLLLSGAIEVTTDGRIVQIIDQEGTFAGDLSPLMSESSASTLTVVQETECLVVPVRYLEDILNQNPEEGINLLGVLAGRLLRNSEYFPDLKLQYEEMVLAEEDEVNFLAALRGEEIIPRKIVLVALENTYEDALSFHFNPMGFKTYFYNNAKEVLENLDSINPDVIVFDAVDFPRHWKPLLKLLRERKSPEESIFILITDKDYPFEEAAKASFLRVNAIIPANLLEKDTIYQLGNLVKRYKNINDRRKYTRLIPKGFERFALLFTHPSKQHFVSGKIEDISLEGCRFVPFHPSLVKGVEEDTEIQRCSLRIGSEIITVNCRITRQGDELGIEFLSFQEDGHQKLFKYLMERSEREMKHLIKKRT
jgi:hypothetical protein